MNEKIKILFYSALEGKLLLRLGVDRYLGHIVYFFLLALLYIWLNMCMDGTMHRMKQNKEALDKLKSIHTEMICELTALNSVCKVEDMLAAMGSDVKIPERPAKKVE